MLRRSPGQTRRCPARGCSVAVCSGDAPGCSAPAWGCSAPTRGRLRAGSATLRDAPHRSGDAARRGGSARHGPAPGVFRWWSRRLLRSGAVRGRCGGSGVRGGGAGSPGAAHPLGAALIAAAAPPPVNTGAPVLSMGGTAPPRPLAAGRGEISASANGRRAERGCWREWQGGTPRYPRYRRYRRRGTPAAPGASAAAAQHPRHLLTCVREPSGTHWRDAPATACTRCSLGLVTPVSPVPPTPARGTNGSSPPPAWGG
ncbi:laforin-like [Colius striatus]|uniref:laforin-like n=1 Tax=Colius striatus TaxID=57412 RepID=UPI002B1DE00B|nr:laforin-like [Colius striatus]